MSMGNEIFELLLPSKVSREACYKTYFSILSYFGSFLLFINPPLYSFTYHPIVQGGTTSVLKS